MKALKRIWNGFRNVPEDVKDTLYDFCECFAMVFVLFAVMSMVGFGLVCLIYTLITFPKTVGLLFLLFLAGLIGFVVRCFWVWRTK